MKRVLFVTVGTSAITAEGLQKNVPGDQGLGRAIKSFEGAESAKEGREKSAALRPRLVLAHAQFWDHLSAKQPRIEHYRQTSAELITTVGLLGSREPELARFFDKDRDDHVVLLASNTEAGELAAEVNAEVLHQQFARRFFREACACGGNLRSCRRILIEVVRGMEPNKQLEELLPQLQEKVRPYHGAVAAFNVTGGFKGTIPYITWLAMNQFPGAPMYYQHEKMDHFVRIAFAADGAREPMAARPVAGSYERLEAAPRLAE